MSTECRYPANLLIALDSTRSVHEANYSIMLDFAKRLVQGLPIGNQAVLVGLQSFSTQSIVKLQLGHFESKNDVIIAMDHVYRAGETYSSEVLRSVKYIFFCNPRVTTFLNVRVSPARRLLLKPFSPGCPRLNIALQVLKYSLKHQSFLLKASCINL